jgi:hypothetical protein
MRMRQRYLVAVYDIRNRKHRSGQARGRGEEKGMSCACSSFRLEIGGHSNQPFTGASSFSNPMGYDLENYSQRWRNN